MALPPGLLARGFRPSREKDQAMPAKSANPAGWWIFPIFMLVLGVVFLAVGVHLLYVVTDPQRLAEAEIGEGEDGETVTNPERKANIAWLLVIACGVCGPLSSACGILLLSPPLPQDPTEEPPEPGEQVSPARLSRDKIGQVVSGRFTPRYASPSRSLRAAPGCTIVAILGLWGASWFLSWNLDLFGMSVAVIAAVGGAALFFVLLPAAMAARRLRVRFFEWPRSARPGDSLRFILFCETGRGVKITKLRLVLACLKALATPQNSNAGQKAAPRTPQGCMLVYYDEAELAVDFRLAAGQRRGFETSLRVPPEAVPTGATTQ